MNFFPINSSVYISVGFTAPKVTPKRMPGWENDSWGYMADDGNILTGDANRPKKYGPPFGNGDVVGCGVNFHRNQMFWTKNGVHLGM